MITMYASSASFVRELIFKPPAPIKDKLGGLSDGCIT